MTRACFLLNDCAVGTLCLEEFPGKVKGMQPAHGMFCSQQEPGGSILCSVLHRLAISGVGVGGESQPSGSPRACDVCCRARIWQERANVSPQQEICQELAQRGASLTVDCLLGLICWKAVF